MKYPLLILALGVGLLSFAQENSSKNDSNQNSTSSETIKNRRNEFSLEFLGIVDGRFIPAYERSFGQHWSAKIGAGPKSEEGLVNFSGIDREKIKTGDLTYSGFIVYGEGRYYISSFNNGRATGFYFGLYGKYSGFQSDFSGTYINDEQEEFSFLFDANIGVTSFGFMFGYKLPLGKRFALDFLIAGPGTANYSFDFKNRSDELPDEFF